MKIKHRPPRAKDWDLINQSKRVTWLPNVLSHFRSEYSKGEAAETEQGLKILGACIHNRRSSFINHEYGRTSVDLVLGFCKGKGQMFSKKNVLAVEKVMF